MPGTSEGIFLVASWLPAGNLVPSTIHFCSSQFVPAMLPLQMTVVRADVEKGKTLLTAGIPLYLVPFPSKLLPEMTTDMKQLALWKSVSRGEIMTGLCLICNLNPWQICIAGIGSTFLVITSLFESTFSQRQPFRVLKFIRKKLGFLGHLAPHLSFSYAVPHFQVVSTTIILNFSQYCFCSNILILHAFNISHP